MYMTFRIIEICICLMILNDKYMSVIFSTYKAFHSQLCVKLYMFILHYTYAFISVE